MGAQRGVRDHDRDDWNASASRAANVTRWASARGRVPSALWSVPNPSRQHFSDDRACGIATDHGFVIGSAPLALVAALFSAPG
jgi:hypothetical protein